MTQTNALTRVLVIVGLVAGTGACSSGGRVALDSATGPRPNDLANLTLRIDSLLSGSLFEDAIWAAQIVDVQTGRTIYERNARTNLVPASNAKLFTTAAALEQLGPGFRYETVLYADGHIRSDTLFGDLVIRGAGDPTISRRYLADPLEVLQGFADSLARRGVRVVTGSVVGDGRAFDDQALGLGWPWNDEPYYYSAQISALTFSDNCVSITTESTTVGRPATLTWRPLDTDYVTVTNMTVTAPASSSRSITYRRERGTNNITVLGSLPEGESDTECVTVEDPAGFAAHVLQAVLRNAGVRVAGSSRSRLRGPADVPSPGRIDDSLGTATRIAAYVSPPMSHIIRQVNKESENLDAELLLRSVGVYRPVPDVMPAPGSAHAGVAALARTLAAAGIDTTYVGHADGSGLSRRNLVTADHITTLLRYMWNHAETEVAASFVASLPVGGLDGTLRRRFGRGAEARYNVTAKTGTMTSVSSLSGYVTIGSRRVLAFSLICNNYSSRTSAVRSAQDKVVNLLAGL